MENGKASSSRQTKHIKVKYFYIKEKVADGEIAVEHCPTEQMWTDINTKPKQGAVLREFRGNVIGIPAVYNDKDYQGKVKSISMPPVPKTRKASKECVEEHPENPKEQTLTNDRPLGVGSWAPIKIFDERDGVQKCSQSLIVGACRGDH